MLLYNGINVAHTLVKEAGVTNIGSMRRVMKSAYLKAEWKVLLSEHLPSDSDAVVSIPCCPTHKTNEVAR